MKILSIQVGLPKTIQHHGRAVTTGIFKLPVHGPVLLKTLNLEGDGQADLRVHGGRDKALYAYSYDVYPNWIKTRPSNDFPFGALGENLTVDELPEDQIFIGDIFELGEAIIQVAQPRMPCQKLAIKFDDPSILKQFMSIGRPGVYYRVLKEGIIRAGDSFKLIEQERVLASVLELFNLSQHGSDSLERLREILRIKSLEDGWRRRIEKSLN